MPLGGGSGDEALIERIVLGEATNSIKHTVEGSTKRADGQERVPAAEEEEQTRGKPLHDLFGNFLAQDSSHPHGQPIGKDHADGASRPNRRPGTRGG